MGMKKTSKRLLRAGKRAARALGAGGKEWVEQVYATALTIIQDEVARRTPKSAGGEKKVAPGTVTAKRGDGATTRSRATPAAKSATPKPVTKPTKKATPKAKPSPRPAARKRSRPAARPRTTPDVAHEPAEPSIEPASVATGEEQVVTSEATGIPSAS